MNTSSLAKKELIDPDFTKKLIHIENNQESQKFFDENTGHFTKQCKDLFKILLKGERVTTLTAIVKYGIASLPRRIKDLRDIYMVPIRDERPEGSRYKEYFIDLEDLKTS